MLYRCERNRRLLEKRSSRHGVQRFEYDALARRIAKTHLETSEAGHQSRPKITRFGWDGLRLLSEIREPLFEQQARHHSLYIYEGEGSYEPLARVDGENKVLHFHNDLSGKPEALSSAEFGQVIWRASYKVWGNTITEEWSGEYAQVDARTVAQNLRFQGQYLDPETGLHYNAFRFYDPDIGRFTTPDPIGLAGGLNLYQYAPNPISWVDPWGWETRPNNGKYNVFHDHTVASGDIYASDAVQFNRANKDLAQRMNSDPAFRRDMVSRYPKLAEWSKKPGSSSPPGLTWHHHENKGKLVLVDRSDHGSNHKLYHPTGKGGRDIWGGGEADRQGKLNGRTGKLKGPGKC